MVGTPPRVNPDDAVDGGWVVGGGQHNPGQVPPLGQLPPGPQPAQVAQLPPGPQPAQVALGPLANPQEMAAAFRMFQTMNLAGVLQQPQQPNPFPQPDAQQLPIFSVNPVHGVLGVRSAAASPVVPQGPVLDLGQGGGDAVDKTKLANILSHFGREQVLLTKARREAEITSTVAGFGNPMSKRSVEFTMRLDDSLDDISAAFSVDGAVLQADATNLPQVNNAIQLVLQAVQDMKARCETNRTKHLVARVSKYGWSFVSSVEECEGRVGHLDMATLRSQEKAYIQHKQAVGGKPGDRDDTPKGKWHAKNQKKKGAASSDSDLRGTSGGGVAAKGKGKGKGKGGGKRKGAPKSGCYRCEGPHFVGDCPLPYAKA